MGFPSVRAEKAVAAMGPSNLEGCIQWLEEHQDEQDIDEPVMKSDVSVMSEEERAKKVAEMKEKIVKRREERAEEEKKNAKASEIKRREMGKQMNSARDEYEKIQREAEYNRRKKEKEEQKRERERLRAEIAKDKAERAARGGKLTGSLASAPAAPAVVEKPQPVKRSPKEEIKHCLEQLKKYRVSGDGLTAVKTLQVYAKNLLKPDEEKFRTINLANAAFRKRVGSKVGGTDFLLAIGFKKNEEKLFLPIEEKDLELVQYALQQLDFAIAYLSN